MHDWLIDRRILWNDCDLCDWEPCARKLTQTFPLEIFLASRKERKEKDTKIKYKETFDKIETKISRGIQEKRSK